MKSGWALAKELVEEHDESSGLFVRLKDDGDKVVGVFCGEPYPRQVVWLGDRYEQYDENNQEHANKRPTLRVSFNFYVPAEDRMKVIEGGILWFKDVSRLNDKYTLNTRVFEVQRNGAAKSAKTTYSILPEDKVDAKLQARIKELSLYDLEALAEGELPAGTSSDKEDSSESPLAEIIARAFMADLKRLPRSEVDTFLTHFGVSRIRELTKGQESEVRKYIKEKLTQQSSTEEVDPFA